MEGKGKKRKTKSVDAMQQQNDYFLNEILGETEFFRPRLRGKASDPKARIVPRLHRHGGTRECVLAFAPIVPPRATEQQFSARRSGGHSPRKLGFERWAEQMPMPGKRHERDAGKEKQCCMNAGPSAETSSFPRSHNGNFERNQPDCGKPAGYMRGDEPWVQSVADVGNIGVGAGSWAGRSARCS